MGLKTKLNIILLAIFFLLPGRAYAASVSDIAKQLVCQCGCNMILLNCSHGECGSRTEMNAIIQQKLSQGESETSIVQSFVSRYGEQVLASPPKRGFNLTAWITPFAAIIFGAGGIYLALMAWVKRGRQVPAPVETRSEEMDDEYRRRVDRELQRFSEKGFR
ncbi:MAG: cytochrome c-type biogenesis protein CcmH [Dehalococcoidia bacterium]|nr:cytochrome c-type biogenesis protein CcmH [Dehalococcoidia bacterium]